MSLVENIYLVSYMAKLEKYFIIKDIMTKYYLDTFQNLILGSRE